MSKAEKKSLPEELNAQDDPRFNNGEAADYLNLSEGTLPVWRHQGKGPDYIKLGAKVFYRKSSLDRFLDEHTVRVGA